MNLNLEKTSFIVALFLTVAVSGCASYRTDSNITSETTPALSSIVDVLILDGVPDRKYKELGPIEVSVKKLTVFHSDPTKEQANQALTEKARILGADAVIRVTYESGIGFTTWGYIDAKGIGVKWAEIDALNPSLEQRAMPQSPSKEARLRELKRLFDAGLITNDAYIDQQKKVLDSAN